MPEEMPNKEAIESYEKIAEENQQKLQEIEENKLPPIIPKKVKDKLVKVIRGVLAGGIVGSPAVFSACKEAPAVVEEQQEEEKGQETVPAETTPKETKKETSPTVEETLEDIEWEGIKITPIEGLRFDKGTFFAEAGNPYNLEVGEKAAVFVIDGLEVNGKMENVIGLDPRVIEFKEKETFKETKERLLAIPIDLTKFKDIKLEELNEAGEEIGKRVLGFNLPVGAEFLAPLSENWIMFRPFPNLEDKQFFTNWDIGVEGKLGKLEIYFRDAEILAEMEEEAQVINPKEGKMQTLMRTKTRLGERLGRIISNTPLENFSKSGWGDYQIVIFLKNKDRMMEVGSGADVCKVFIFNQ